MCRKEIHKLTLDLCKNVPGSRQYMQYYNKARSEVERSLTDDERQRYKAMAKEWSERKLPPKMQQRYVHGSESSISGLADISKLA